jgi:hypothetical protein
VADHFESTYQKVGTFRVVNGQKLGGNVATYFCLADGTVVHAVAGPVGARQFLTEARWAVDLRKLAAAEAGGDVARYRATVRKGHLERLASEGGLSLPPNTLPKLVNGPPPVPTAGLVHRPAAQRTGTQGQVHVLLAYSPLARLEHLYPIVFEQVLGERVSTLPVQTQ